jgi:hypothetical protein
MENGFEITNYGHEFVWTATGMRSVRSVCSGEGVSWSGRAKKKQSSEKEIRKL